MKRVLVFPLGDAHNDQRFELVYSALLIGPAPKADGRPPDPRGREVMLREASLFDELDAISDPHPDPSSLDEWPDKTTPRVVRPGSRIVLPQLNYDLLKSRVTDANWKPKFARAYRQTIEWLSAAPELKPEEAPPTAPPPATAGDTLA